MRFSDKGVYNIAIDIGNTFCKIGVAYGDGLAMSRKVLRDGLLSGLDELTGGRYLDIIIVSCVQEDDMELYRALENRCRRLVILNGRTPVPVKNSYATLETLGADRIASAVGADYLFPGEDCLIFDFGTAITIDFKSADGTFKGGNISPGMNTRFKAIHQYTNRLPLVSPKAPDKLKGKSTEEAVCNGVVLGIMFEVEGYIRKHPGYRIVFTGGDSIFFADKLDFPIFVVYNLVLTGLVRIAAYLNEIGA